MDPTRHLVLPHNDAPCQGAANSEFSSKDGFLTSWTFCRYFFLHFSVKKLVLQVDEPVLTVRELCLLSWVRMVWVGLERELCLLREVFLVICTEMATREEGNWWCPLPLGPT